MKKDSDSVKVCVVDRYSQQRKDWRIHQILNRWDGLSHHHFRNEADYEISRQRFEFSKTGEDAPYSTLVSQLTLITMIIIIMTNNTTINDMQSKMHQWHATHKLSSSSGFPVTVVFSDLSKVKSKASTGEAEINFFYTKNITEFSDHAATPSQLPPRRCGWWLS